MSKRQEILDEIASAILELGRFDKVTSWQDTDTGYGISHLDYRDTTEEYTKKNTVYDAALSIEIAAIVYGDETKTAQEMGTIVLTDLINTVRTLALPKCLFDLARSHKWVETKGKTACCVELELIIHYKF